MSQDNFAFAFRRYIKTFIRVFILVGIWASMNSAQALDVDYHIFKQCVYTPGECACCRQVDIIADVMGYSRFGNIYLSENSRNIEIIYLLYTPSGHAKKLGYRTFVIRKSEKNKEWHVVLSGRSIGMVSQGIFYNKSSLCLQRTASTVDIYASNGQEYILEKKDLNSSCKPKSTSNIKDYFNPK